MSTNELEMIRGLMGVYSEKVFVYDGDEVKGLRARVEGVVKSVEEFERERREVGGYLREVERQNRELVEVVQGKGKGRVGGAESGGIGKIRCRKEESRV